MLTIAHVVFVLLLVPGHQRCDMLLRIFVSRNAAGRGRAILEGLGLPLEVRNMCYANNPMNEEEAVQSGLMKWANGSGDNPTWTVVLRAMEYAGIAVQHVSKLKDELLKGIVSQAVMLTNRAVHHVPSNYNVVSKLLLAAQCLHLCSTCGVLS